MFRTANIPSIYCSKMELDIFFTVFVSEVTNALMMLRSGLKQGKEFEDGCWTNRKTAEDELTAI